MPEKHRAVRHLSHYIACRSGPGCSCVLSSCHRYDVDRIRRGTSVYMSENSFRNMSKYMNERLKENEWSESSPQNA